MTYRPKTQREHHAETRRRGQWLIPPIHLAQRVFERHGWRMSPRDYTYLIEAIWAGDAEHVDVPLEDRPPSAKAHREHFRVEAYGEFYVFVYDPRGDMIVTVLHSGWLKFEDGRWRMRYKKPTKQINYENGKHNLRRKINGY